MPINFETMQGYYDGQGIFHPNTGLMPSPVKDWAYTVPINPTKTIPFIDYNPGFQYTGTTAADLYNNTRYEVEKAIPKVPQMPDMMPIALIAVGAILLLGWKK